MTHSQAENGVWAVMAAIMVPRSFDQSEDLAVGGVGWKAAHNTAKAASRGKT
jgi:hypothetical protein